MFRTRLKSVGQRLEVLRRRACPGALRPRRRARQRAQRLRRASAHARTFSPANPRVLERVAHALDAKAQQRPGRPRRSTAGHVRRDVAARASDERRAQTLAIDAGQLRKVHQDADRAVRLPAQPERIARSGRPLAREEQPHERVELVGQRHRRPRRPPRRRAARASAARPLRRRSAGSGSRSPSRPARARRPRARRCRPSCPAAR